MTDTIPSNPQFFSLQVYRPVGVVQEGLPAFVLGIAQLDRQQRAPLGLERRRRRRIVVW